MKSSGRRVRLLQLHSTKNQGRRTAGTHALFLLTFSASFFWASCTREVIEVPPDYKSYPENIGRILLTHCAVTGCHNDASKEAASGLSLSSWGRLFEGGRNNAAVVPYRSDQSILLYYINTFDDLGPALKPTMPFGSAPLTREEVLCIRNWINNGAPSAGGEVMFSSDPDRAKIYVANQGCDLIAVIDAETGLIMRYADAGVESAVEVPHMLKTAPDGKSWYSVFTEGTILQKFNASDDRPSGQAVIGQGSWNTFTITSDSKYAFAVDLSAEGKVALVNLETMSLITTYAGSGLFSWPHGSYVTKNSKHLYLTSQYGNILYKVDLHPNFGSGADPDDFHNITLGTGEFFPHEILFSPDETRYFVTCQKTNEVRSFSYPDDSFLASIPTGIFPQEMAVSAKYDYLFVTCTEDTLTFPGKRGSVSVINYKTLNFVRSVHTGHQPHGLTVDEERNAVYVAHRNISPDGPAPHHTTDCAGRNGYVTKIDLLTLEPVSGYKVEVSVDPYAMTIKP